MFDLVFLSFFRGIVKFLYSLERKYPEFSKTLPTFIHSSLLVPATNTIKGFSLGTPCILIILILSISLGGLRTKLRTWTISKSASLKDGGR